MPRWMFVSLLVACGSSAKPAEITPVVSPPPSARVAVELIAGDDHTCARLSDRSVWCWGEGEAGQLGVEIDARYEPTEVRTLADAAAVVAGGEQTCGIFDGVVRCLDGGRALVTPKQLQGVGVTVLSFGLRTTCAALTTGTVRCFDADGSDDIELGDVAELGSGYGERCARTRAGQVTCWERGLPRRAIALTDVVSMAVGWEHACVALADGHVWCWGGNASHQRGAPKLDGSGPLVVDGIRDAVQVVAAMRATCVRHRTGDVTCWGDLMEPWGAPKPVAGVHDAIALATGDRHACAIRRNGDVTCWGTDSDGQLGRPPFAARARSEAIPNLTKVTNISSDGSRTCALDDATTVWCWGSWSPPTSVASLAGARALALGFTGGCVIRADRTVACWKTIPSDEFGDPPTQSPLVAVPGLRDVDEVAVGYRHTCARSGGTVRCWGGNTSGQLGDGTKIDRAAPVAIPRIADATRLFLDGNSTCVARKAGGLTCWGAAEGRDFTDAVAVAGAGDPAACKLLATGEVKCTGYNGHGELGNGTIEYHQKPGDWVDAANLADVVDLSTNATRACAVRRDGTLWCWGNTSETFGLAASRRRDCNLGDGPPEPCVRAPRPVPEIMNATRVLVGPLMTCVLINDGTVRCWGRPQAIGWGKVAPPPARVPLP